jgi:hypothetical protein
MSKGYKVASDDPKPFEIVMIPPAGSISISGTDMARFAIAHLQNGAFQSSRILQEATAVQMHGTRSVIIPPLNSMLLGFYENNINGHRVITHGGDTSWFHSELNLLVDDGVALYTSLNSLGKDGAAGPIRTMLFEEFARRYFPGPLPEGQAPFVWRNVDGGDRLAAKVENGRVTRFGVDEFPFMLFEPVEWWRSSAWLLPLWIASLVVLALTALTWPVSALVRRHYGAAYGLTGVDARAHRIVRIALVLVVGVTIAWIVFLQMMENDSGSLTSPGSDILVSSLRLLSFAVFVAGVAIALWNAWAVLRSRRRWLAKARSVVLALSCLTVLYVGILFHLVGYSTNY